MGMAERIKERRLAMGYTQEELATKLGLQKSAIAKYENGRVENIKRSIISKMAEILECSPAYLMDWSERKSAVTAFEDYLQSLDYQIYRDDPEHKPFIIVDHEPVRLEYDTLSTLKEKIDKYTQLLVEPELLRLHEIQRQKEKRNSKLLMDNLLVRANSLEADTSVEVPPHFTDIKSAIEYLRLANAIVTSKTDFYGLSDDDFLKIANMLYQSNTPT